MKVFVDEVSDYFTLFEKVVRISDTENVLFKRMNDGTVLVSYEDHITGSLIKLAHFRDGKWMGHNPRNLERMISLFRTHKNLKPALFRFITPDDESWSMFKIDKYITCAKRRFHLSLRKVAKVVHYNYPSEKS